MIGERIKYLRKNKLNLTQEAFSSKIKISRSNLGSIETSRVSATDRVLFDICREFNVDEDWLRNGGPDENMFIEYPEDAELGAYVESLLSDKDDSIVNLIRNFLIIYKRLDKTSQNILRSVADDLLSKKD